MKRINQAHIRFAVILTLLITFFTKGICQTAVPEVLNNGTLIEQMNYIEDRTRIYENYRAIREDMFQLMKENSLDSLAATKLKINSLQNIAVILNHSIDSLTTSLKTTESKLNEITASKNSISVLGMEVNKTTYNLITWTLVAGLIFILVIGFLAFKRNMFITIQTKRGLEEMKNEFEEYRQTTREAREKMSMAHFNELKKLKGG